MATPVPCSLLALLGLAFLQLLACTTTADDLIVRSAMDITTLLPHASVLPLGPDEPTTPTHTGRPASSNRLGASPSASTFSGVSQPRLNDASFIAREDNATCQAATTATAPTTPPSPRVCCVQVHTRDEPAAVHDTGILQTPPGGRGTTAPSMMAAVLKALPLLAIPFLPPPVAALVVLSSLATPVCACSEPYDDDDSGSGPTHATCTVYRYLHDSGTIDRAQPFADLRAVCPHPLRNAGSGGRALSTAAYGHRRGRLDNDPFHGYCSVNTLEVGVVPETGHRCLCSVRVHLPVTDLTAVMAAGGDVCYVELEQMNYRVGYYIRCPVRDCSHEPVVCCKEFPHDAIAADAVRERLIYRHAVGWYSNNTASPQLEGEVYQYHDEL